MKEGGDANPRENRMAERLMPRVQLYSNADASVLQGVLLTESVTWARVISAIQTVKRQQGQEFERSQLTLRVENVTFEDDATEEQVDILLAEAEGMMALETNGCTFQTETGHDQGRKKSEGCWLVLGVN